MPKQSNKKQKIKQILSSDFDIEKKLKNADFEIQEYVRALENKILKLNDEYFKMKTENTTIKKKLSELEIQHIKGNIFISESK